MLKKPVSIPTSEFWINLAESFGNNLIEEGERGFIQYLCDYMLDDIGIFQDIPNTETDDFHIVERGNQFHGYIGGVLYFKSVSLVELLMNGIFLHTIFEIKYPQTILLIY